MRWFRRLGRRGEEVEPGRRGDAAFRGWFGPFGADNGGGSGRRFRLRRLGVVLVLAVALLALGGCVADPPPLMGTAVSGNHQATVSWQAPLAIPFPITAYVVTPWIGQVRQTPIQFNSTATTQTVTGLTNGATYTFTVVAINTLGNDSASSDLLESRHT